MNILLREEKKEKKMNEYFSNEDFEAYRIFSKNFCLMLSHYFLTHLECMLLRGGGSLVIIAKKADNH